MHLRYDDDFLEGAVFIRANSRLAPLQSPLQLRRFHSERERLYRFLDQEERNAAFFRLHLEWFREWGLEKFLLGVVEEFPLLRSALATLVIRKARLAKEEGAELYVSSENGRSGVVALRVERVEHLRELRQFLQHEFMHLHDMVDQDFGYSPHIHLPGQNAAQQRLTRERYRLLWDITIDARLARRCSAFCANRAVHQAGFERMFDFWPESKRQEAFDLLWHTPTPQHAELLGIASDPRGVLASAAATPGSPCPLCGFATFDWSETRALSEELRHVIQAEFPHWSPADGACRRCIRIYSKVPSQALIVL